MIEPSGQQAAGGTSLYLVSASALAFSDPSGIQWYDAGSVPVAPESLKFNGQAAISSGVTNADGSVSGLALVSDPSGALLPLAVRAPASLYSVNNPQVTNVTLQIFDTNTGINLSAQTNTVIVGQQMNLTCQLSVTNQYMTNFPLANFQWTVPGFAISNYVVAPDASSATVVTNFPLNNSNVVFYWVDGGTKQVQCSATVAGKTVTGKVTFNVNKPLPNFSVEAWGSVTADANYIDPGLYLHFGKGTGNDIGIAMSLTNVPINPSNGIFYGAYFVTQLLGKNVRENVTTGTNVSGWQFDQQGLDNQVEFDKVTASMPGDLTSNPLWVDSPSIQFGGIYRWVSESESFTNYLMFLPPGGNSIAIPMYLASWGWTGSAKTNGASGGILLSHSVPPPTVAVTTDFPQWTNLVTNDTPVLTIPDIQTNLPPFDEN